ncbi:MAG: anhydro-N-acetylmuramic acid kinase [Methylothermaceae bacterium]|nr:anhydro-N-acetylmuramic acid kinase [Methylothermaceae bacterium]
MSAYFIGLMAGTSLDGVDAVLAEISAPPCSVALRAQQYAPFEPPLRQRLERHCFSDRMATAELGQLDAELGELFGRCALALLKKARVPPDRVRAIGSHGQTFHHHPSAPYPYTLQIGDPNRIAEITGITTVADFRRRDMAAGGQGAPLVPAFHRAVFHSPREDRTVLNLGGIANLTFLPADPTVPVTGFDTGPGNTLMDHWIGRHRGASWDEGGRWARQGRPIPELLQALVDDPYFSEPPPKSTGPEYFSPAWLEKRLQAFSDHAPKDVQATLAHLTAAGVGEAIRQAAIRPARLLVCGGGAHNRYLLEILENQAGCPVETTAAYGIDPDWVEAAAFAWLAWRTLEGLTGNLPAVTGARHEVVLGGIYPGT